MRTWYHGGRKPDLPPAQQSCMISQNTVTSVHASLVVIHSTESIKDEAIWDEVHLRMNRMHSMCNRADLVFKHWWNRTKLLWRLLHSLIKPLLLSKRCWLPCQFIIQIRRWRISWGSQALLMMGSPAWSNPGAVKVKTCCIQGFVSLQCKAWRPWRLTWISL